MYLHCYTSNYIIHISVYNTETLECSQTLCECLMILEPVFKLTSHDALANINDNEVMEYVRHVNFRIPQ